MNEPIMMKGVTGEYSYEDNANSTERSFSQDLSSPLNPINSVDSSSQESPSTPISSPDMVNHPPHYTQGGVECIDAMQAALGDKAVAYFCVCNAFKYIFRHLNKNHREDIKKAQWYLTKYLELTENTVL